MQEIKELLCSEYDTADTLKKIIAEGYNINCFFYSHITDKLIVVTTKNP